jgi:hypothetical protein
MSNKMEADEHEVEIAARAMMRDLTKTKNYSHGCLFDFPPVNPDNVVVRGHVDLCALARAGLLAVARRRKRVST